MSRLRTDTSRAVRASLLAALGLLGASCGGNATGSGDPVTTPAQCRSSKIDPKTQLPMCAEGFSHRPAPVRCEPTALGGAVPDPAPAEPALCNGNDCSTLKFGYCSYGFLSPTCKSGCVTDADCERGFICSCTSSNSPTGGECVPSNCTSDADCGGALCASSHEICGELRFACLSEADECQADRDCKTGICTIGSDGHRACFSGACGRPFLVQSTARLPGTTARGDWLDACFPRVDHLSAAERAALTEHWLKLGQMEHASIAAFARFQLQLLSLAAPPELIELCTGALADETAHTKLCFGLASAYAGRAIGPGALDISSSLELTALTDVVDLVLAEGCFGETSAALEALEAADGARDPVVRAAYLRIATDEQRHAELAFRFVRWALERGGESVTATVHAFLDRDFVRDHAARGVAEPCLRGLIAASHVA